MTTRAPDVQDRMNAYWDARASSYDAWQRRPERRDVDRAHWARIWADALPEAPVDVLDVGTGSGHVACTVASLGHRVTGIDLAPGMLAAARANAARETHPPRIVAGDAVMPDFADASFDVVIGRYVMWTLREPVRAIAAWQRVLRPGGRVVLVDSTWFPDGLIDTHQEMERFYDEEVLAALPVVTARSIEATSALLREAGLRDVEVHPLHDLFELDRRLGVAPHHAVQLQYLLAARA